MILFIFWINELGFARHALPRFLDERIEIELCYLRHNGINTRLGLGVSWGKDCTAILIRQNRGFKGAVFSRFYDYLVFIKTYTRTEYGNIHNRIGDLYRRKRLRCNLAKAFAGDERVAVEAARRTLGKSHHKYAENEGEIILIAPIANLLLNMRERYNVYVNARAIAAHFFGKRHNLFSCALRGVRI